MFLCSEPFGRVLRPCSGSAQGPCPSLIAACVKHACASEGTCDEQAQHRLSSQRWCRRAEENGSSARRGSRGNCVPERLQRQCVASSGGDGFTVVYANHPGRCCRCPDVAGTATAVDRQLLPGTTNVTRIPFVTSVSAQANPKPR